MKYSAFILLTCFMFCGCQHKASTQASSVQHECAGSQRSEDSVWVQVCEDSENDAYWEEQRKHSPNDNYLLGFDEDVDDVHDMEIYIEDY